MRKCFVALCCLFCFSLFSYAQVRDRIYIHTDKSGYVAGETVWLKAYLFSGMVPGSLATNLFLDITDGSGKSIRSEKLPVFGGIAIGNIDLPFSAAQGIYFLRAYTKTQPSQKIDFSFAKTLYVVNPSIALIEPPSGNESQFRFQSSFGDMIAGIENTVYISARDASGHPLVVNGTIINSKNEEAVPFKTDTKGRARFVYTPAAGILYKAKIEIGGTVTTVDLPKADENKIALSVTDEPKAKIFNVSIPPAQRNGSVMTVRGFMDHNIVFEKNFPAANDRFSARIPVDELPSGLLQLIVTDAGKQKLGETATWVTADNSFLSAQLHVDTLNTSPQGKNVLSFKVDSDTMSSFSVSVTDNERTLYVNDNNIITGLLLSQDSRDQSFIDNTNVQDPQELQMAMGMTNWADQSQYAGRNSFAVDSDYVTITGHVFNKGKKKQAAKGEINFMFEQKDSVTSVLNATVGSAGNFRLPGLTFEGKRQFKYSWNDKWGDVEIVIDSAAKESAVEKTFVTTALVDRSLLQNFVASKSAGEIFKALTMDSVSSTGLRNVTVTGRRTNTVQQVNDKYARGMFASMGMARSLDLINNPPAPGAPGILDYIRGRIPGITIHKDRTGVHDVIEANRAISMMAQPPVLVFLNENEVASTDMVSSIQASEVALVKYYPPGTSSIPLAGSAPVLAIYTKTPEDLALLNPSMNSFFYEGYAPIKNFEDDFLLNKKMTTGKRNTIYWNPNLLPEKEKNIYKIRFNNSDAAHKFHVVIEGVTIDGRLLHFEKDIE